MFRKHFVSAIPVIYMMAEYGKDDSCPIDQSPVEQFNIDPSTGRPMSDITKLVRAQSQYEKQQILKQLDERPLSDVMTLEQIRNELKYGKPRLAQLPSELADYAEYAYKAVQDTKNELEQSDFDSTEKELSKLLLGDAKEYIRTRKAEKEKEKDELKKS